VITYLTLCNSTHIWWGSCSR